VPKLVSCLQIGEFPKRGPNSGAPQVDAASDALHEAYRELDQERSGQRP
jgi:hypothetical protein